MRRFFKVVVARWLARTPIGLAVLGVGWFLGRRRRRRAQVQAEQTGQAEQTRQTGRNRRRG